LDSVQEVVERKGLAARHHDFGIENERCRLQSQRGVDQFGKIAREIFAGFGTESYLSAVARNNAAEAVPFWFILPFAAARNRIDRMGFHRCRYGSFCSTRRRARR